MSRSKSQLPGYGKVLVYVWEILSLQILYIVFKDPTEKQIIKRINEVMSV